MIEVLVISDSEVGLEGVFNSLNLLSIPCSQHNMLSLNRYTQNKNRSYLFLLRIPGLDESVVNSTVISDIITDQPLALLVDASSETTEAFALEHGCVGVLSLDMPADKLVKALTTLYNGGLWYTRAALEQLVSNQLKRRRTQKSTDALGSLTSREKIIAKLSSEGLANAEIAASLHLSPNTVKTHMQSILRKTQVKNRTQLSALFNAV